MTSQICNIVLESHFIVYAQVHWISWYSWLLNLTIMPLVALFFTLVCSQIAFIWFHQVRYGRLLDDQLEVRFLRYLITILVLIALFMLPRWMHSLWKNNIVFTFSSRFYLSRFCCLRNVAIYCLLCIKTLYEVYDLLSHYSGEQFGYDSAVIKKTSGLVATFSWFRLEELMGMALRLLHLESTVDILQHYLSHRSSHLQL